MVVVAHAPDAGERQYLAKQLEHLGDRTLKIRNALIQLGKPGLRLSREALVEIVCARLLRQGFGIRHLTLNIGDYLSYVGCTEHVLLFDVAHK